MDRGSDFGAILMRLYKLGVRRWENGRSGVMVLVTVPWLTETNQRPAEQGSNDARNNVNCTERGARKSFTEWSGLKGDVVTLLFCEEDNENNK